MTRLARDHPGDKEKVKAEAIKRLDEVVEKLPLPKSQIEREESQIKRSTLLQEILGATQKRALKERVRRALAELIAEDVV